MRNYLCSLYSEYRLIRKKNMFAIEHGDLSSKSQVQSSKKLPKSKRALEKTKSHIICMRDCCCLGKECLIFVRCFHLTRNVIKYVHKWVHVEHR